jgi:hypothetical protein
MLLPTIRLACTRPHAESGADWSVVIDVEAAALEDSGGVKGQAQESGGVHGGEGAKVSLE